MIESEYYTIYENLRSLGYRAHDEYQSHMIYVVKWIVNNLNFSNVLDVGSSSGGAVGLIESFIPNIKAYGLDISPTAILMGNALGREMVCGSALNLPFKNNSFDLVISSDTLEHIAPEDIDRVIDNIVRVSKKYIFMQICTKKDIAPWGKIIGRKLHLTIRNIEWWIEKFKNNLREIPTEIIYLKDNAFCFRRM